MAGGKGVNVARALRLLGRPVIAAGMAGGATGTRLVDELRNESVLTAFTRDRWRDADQPRGHRPDHRRADRDQRSRARGRPRPRSTSSSSTCSTWPRGRRSAYWLAARRRAPTRRSTVAWSTELRALGVTTVLDTDGEQMRAALRAEPNVVAPNLGEAEEAVGHEFNDAGRSLARAHRPDRDGRRRGDHHLRGRLRGDRRRRRRAPPLRGPHRSARAGDLGRLGRLLPRRLRRGALREREPARVPGVRGGMRRRVDPALRGRAPSTGARSSACCRAFA